MRAFEARKVDELGRVVLPIELRKSLNINAGNSLDLFVNDSQQIILVKSVPNCKICGETEDLKETANKQVFICSGCLAALPAIS